MLCSATGRGRPIGNVAWARGPEQGGWPLTEQGARLDWMEGPSSVGRTGTGKDALGIILQICAPHHQSHFPRRTLSRGKAAFTRACVKAEEPLGDLTGHPCAWTSRLLPTNARAQGGLLLASLLTQTTFFSKLRPAFKMSPVVGPFPREVEGRQPLITAVVFRACVL